MTQKKQTNKNLAHNFSKIGAFFELIVLEVI